MRIQTNFRRVSLHILLLTICVWCLAIIPVRAQTLSGAPKTALVLYDASGPYGSFGFLYCQQMVNILSHFPVQVTTRPVENYAAQDIEQFDTTFYLGILYDNPIPDAFLKDVLSTTKPICWINYNLWQIAWKKNASGGLTYNTAFTNKFGLSFWGLEDTGYATVKYKGVKLTKAETSLNRVFITNANRAKAVATSIKNNGLTVPYIAHGNNFWFVADNPFEYVTFTDRYLAFADVLHDILRISHPANHRALVRIEDVAPIVDPMKIYKIADTLAAERVPFIICVIPEYRDPLGVYNNGKPQTITLADAPAFVKALKYAEKRGGRVIQHGYTHQSGVTVNPFTGISGDDFEFYRVGQYSGGGDIFYQGPVIGDSEEWALQRLMQGRLAMLAAGLNPLGWNTPHYTASAVDYQAFASVYKLEFCRGLYFSMPGDPANTQILQQMAPYILNKDVFGVKRIPETLGYLEPQTDPPTLPADMLTRANANWVVRDGWAAFYYHPFLNVSYLRNTVRLLKNRGYTFVKITEDIQ